jgi:hypothetical protein
VRSDKQLLSARNLDDIPESVRIGSPYDADDGIVYKLAKQGILHPQANYGVVYRVAFMPQMAPSEQPISVAPSGLPVEGMPSTLALRSGWVIPPERFSDSGDDFEITPTEVRQGLFAAWVLLTNQGVRWHYTGDGVPQLHPGIDAQLGGGVRFLTYPDLQGPSDELLIQLTTQAGILDMDTFVFTTPSGFRAFAFGGSHESENRRWFEFVRRQD